MLSEGEKKCPTVMEPSTGMRAGCHGHLVCQECPGKKVSLLDGVGGV